MRKTGFTLVELSIVLVIIGLIIGGVLVGKDLLNSAQIRSQISQIEEFRTAANTFKLKYGNLPGDIPNADATAYGMASRGLACTNNPIGNGIIQGASCNNFVISIGETALFWRDLSFTNLIAGTFNYGDVGSSPGGVSTITEATTPAIADVHPRAKIAGNYVYVYSGNGCTTGCYGISKLDIIGNTCSASSSVGLSVLQASSIDTKMDDGTANTGKVLAQYVDPDSCGGYSTPTNGSPSTSTCFRSSTPRTYTTEIDGGNNINCALSFKF